MVNENSLANLEGHKFQAGQSGNPGGRPKETISGWIEEFLKMPIEELLILHADLQAQSKMTAKQAIAFRQVARSVQGYQLETDRVIERSEGKAKQVVEIIGTEILEDHRRMLKEIVGGDNAGQS